jgi:hypothetical protein
LEPAAVGEGTAACGAACIKIGTTRANGSWFIGGIKDGLSRELFDARRGIGVVRLSNIHAGAF